MGSAQSNENSSNFEDENHHSNNDDYDSGTSCGIKTVNELSDKYTRNGRTVKTEHSTEASLRKKGDAKLLRTSAEADAQFGLGEQLQKEI